MVRWRAKETSALKNHGYSENCRHIRKTDIKNLPIGPGIMPVISFFGKNKIMEKKNCLRHGRLLFEELTVGMNAH